MAEIRLVDIEKKYGNFLAVPKQSLTIHDGEFLVLLGPSGCGKTTTMRMIAGLEDITSGDIMIKGERINDKPPKDRDIAMVFQNYGLYPHMTVRQNIEYPLKLRGMAKAARKDRVRETAEKWNWMRCWNAARRNCPVVSDSASHSPALLCAHRRSF